MAIPSLKRTIRWAVLCGLLLALFAGQALALGLGRIEVKSRAGEPLLAEIQVISSDPAELDALRARLASPETFRRIGLPAPDAVLSGLEFAVALDARGRPVIRVTTREPVTQPALTFLVEVDWGQGRLVREYSALVAAPQTVSAPAQPAIQAPAAAPSNTIVRAPAAAPVTPEAAAAAEATDDAASVAAADEGREPAAEPPARPAPAAPAAARPAPAPAVSAPPAAPAAPVAGEYGPVQAGETLGGIAQGLVGEGIRREQAIVALFRANPDAFIAGNLNLMRQGAVLRIPGRDEIAGLDLRESRALMREQIAAWREMTSPAPQPGAAPAAAGAPADAADGDAAAASAPRTADARLEIVPPSAAGARQAGTRSGIQAGGEGEMLRQELQQELVENRETLAARSAEVEELKARVADLERLQAQQAQLIELKDSELAAAQERLASSASAEPVAAAVRDGVAVSWPWIGLGLLVVALAAWLLARRAPKTTPRPRFGTAAASVGGAGPAVIDGRAEASEAGREPARQDATADGAIARTGDAPTPVAPEAPAPDVPWTAAAPVVEAAPAAPTWHAAPPAAPSAAPPSAAPPSAAAAAALSAAPSAAPSAPAPSQPDDAGAAGDVASLGYGADGSERIELARAYLDLGDTDTARELLREVAEGGDATSRAEAARLLDGIA